MKGALAFALRYRSRKRHDAAGGVMAQITAEHLFQHLEQSGLVVMHKVSPRPGPDTQYAPSVKNLLREWTGEEG